jgi:hypothetical protein
VSGRFELAALDQIKDAAGMVTAILVMEGMPTFEPAGSRDVRAPRW